MATAGRSRPGKIGVVILEDIKVSRRGIELEIAEDEDLVLLGSTGDPQEFLALVEKFKPEAVIVDLELGLVDMDGEQALRRVKESSPKTKCVVFTAHADFDHFLGAFKARADALLRKADAVSSQPELPEAVKLVAAGGTWYDPEHMKQLSWHVDNAPVPSPLEGIPDWESRLTLREKAAVRAICGGARSLDDIAKEMTISVHTAKNHVQNIRGKLGLDPHRNPFWEIRAAVELTRAEPDS